MTHHIITSKARILRNFSLAKYKPGKISILQPGMGDPDFVSESWLKRYRNELPPGTVVKNNGTTFVIT